MPRALTGLLSFGVTVNPQTQNISIIDVTPSIQTWVFPQPLPPVNFVTILTGGMPGKVYTTKYRVLGPDGQEVGASAGPDVPFTTQIRRINLYVPAHGITAQPIVTGPGAYTFELYVSDELVATAAIDFLRVPPPLDPTAPQPSS
jgi:hypothetical protein